MRNEPLLDRCVVLGARWSVRFAVAVVPPGVGINADAWKPALWLHLGPLFATVQTYRDEEVA